MFITSCHVVLPLLLLEERERHYGGKVSSSPGLPPPFSRLRRRLRRRHGVQVENAGVAGMGGAAVLPSHVCFSVCSQFRLLLPLLYVPSASSAVPFSSICLLNMLHIRGSRVSIGRCHACVKAKKNNTCLRSGSRDKSETQEKAEWW